MAAALSGTLYTLGDSFFYVGPLVRSALHTHHAGQIMWVPDGVALRTDEQPEQRSELAIIRPRQPHAHGEAPLAAVLWLDGDDVRWKEGGSLEMTLPSVLTLFAAGASPDTLLQLLLPAEQAASQRHPAVKRMCALLDAGASTPSHELELAELARRAGLSERQLRDVFLRDTGLSPRAYLRWRRLRRAVASIREGASLTQAAVEAGFADGPHFSRVFRAQFGMSPTSALGSVQFGPVIRREPPRRS